MGIAPADDPVITAGALFNRLIMVVLLLVLCICNCCCWFDVFIRFISAAISAVVVIVLGLAMNWVWLVFVCNFGSFIIMYQISKLMYVYKPILTRIGSVTSALPTLSPLVVVLRLVICDDDGDCGCCCSGCGDCGCCCNTTAFICCCGFPPPANEIIN